MMKYFNLFLYILLPFFCFAQEANTLEKAEHIFSLEEFLAMVKKHHPVVAQANLKISEAEAKLLKARGSFDPKLEGGVKEKNYNGTEYYSLWNGSFTIPTWYGIDVKADYEQNEGYYLNGQNTTPEDGIFSAGVSVSVLKGLLYNDRMNSVRQAKILQNQNEVERDILVNSILTEATKAYADWKLYYENKTVFEDFLNNAQIRFNGISRSSELGETRAIDTVETKIFLRSRELDLKQANLQLQKAKLNLSNYLWVDKLPVELENNLIPQISEENMLANLGIDSYFGNAENLSNHPELRSLEYDLQSYDLDIKLGKNNLMPTLDVEYRFLTENVDRANSLNTNNYKAGVKLKFPLFLRKERGDLRIAKIKRENTEYKFDQKKWTLKNKIKATEQEIISLKEQLEIIENIVADSQTMVVSERRLFDLGESSIFLINSRENKLIDVQLKQNKIQNTYFKAAAKLFENLRLNLLDEAE
ncbi:TolC family protein [Mesonia aestuariivivens]|uniref:TolC family protein n=1 Tax=Mesonia aestuariivivens TaxID=2796128 RepID=A0ABS6W1C6_9FLAO|nr:TolC family protein [Mesonia aestuariivivens]MBW2961337.1 TolC family protein [Mesonia aestuariivivens]